MNTAKRIRRFVENHLVDRAKGSGGDPLAEGLLDSLAIEQLIAYTEETFDIVFDDEELGAENFATIETVARLVDRKLAASA